LLLSDSGAGKSTFNRQLEYGLWHRYKNTGKIPLLQSLFSTSDVANIQRPYLASIHWPLNLHALSPFPPAQNKAGVSLTRGLSPNESKRHS
jgi:hypothetical protein